MQFLEFAEKKLLEINFRSLLESLFDKCCQFYKYLIADTAKESLDFPLGSGIAYWGVSQNAADAGADEREIEAKTSAANDDSLRCRRSTAILHRRSATKLAENSVRAAMIQKVRRTSAATYTKKIRSECWKAAIGQWESEKAAWR